MAFGFAGAAAGGAEALQDILARAFAQKQAEQMMALRQQEAARMAAAQQQQAEQFNRRQGLDEQQFAAETAFRTGQQERQGRLDDVADAERRQVGNQRGVRRMMGDFLMQRGSAPLDAGARNQLLGMGLGEGVELPDAVLTDPGQAQRDRLALEEQRHKYDMEEIGARNAGDMAVVNAREAKGAEPNRAFSTGYADERRQRNLQSVDELMGKVGYGTAGAGSLLSKLPGTPARDFAAELDTLKANIAFGELTEMRNASKTGGALGQVSERELALLTATLGALDPGQSPENLKAQLQKVKDSLIRWQAAQASATPMSSHGAAPAVPTAAPVSDVIKWIRGPDGRPVRAQ